MSYQHPAQTLRPADNHRGLRLLALTAVVVGLMLLAAAAFVLSYAGIHEVALSAGVSSRWARLYPLIFDAMLVIACAAVLSLRGAGLPSRCYAWVSMLALFAAAAGADTVHATGITLPRKPTAAAAAIIPWALVLMGFGLLLCMLRQARLRRAAAAAAPEKVFPERPGHVEVRAGAHEARAQGSDPAGAAPSPPVAASPTAVGVTASASPAALPSPPPDAGSTSPATATSSPSAAPSSPSAASPSAPALSPDAASPSADAGSPASMSASPATPPGPSASPVPAPARDTSDRAGAAVDPELDLALEADPGPDDPASDEGSMWFPPPGSEQLAETDLEPDGPAADDRPASAFSAAPTMSPDAETDGSAPDHESDEGRGMFLGLVAKPVPDGPPLSQLPPHPRVAPEATFGSQPELAPNPKAAPGITPQPQPATEAALRPEPGTGPEPGAGDEVAAQPQAETESEPEAATQPQADTEPEPEPQPGASPDPQPAPPSDPRPAPDAQPTRHTPPQPRPAPESGASLPAASPPEPDPGPKAADRPGEPESGPEPAVGATPTSGGDPEPESGVVPPAAAPPLDRMRSSPLPPEA